jgi:hypothetical protein
MRKLLLLVSVLLLLFCALPASVYSQTPAQDEPNRFGAAGLGYFSQAVPQFQGWAAMALPLTADGKTLSYTDIDLSVVSSGGQLSVAGHQLRYTMRTGVAYRVYLKGSFALYGLAAPGFAATGDQFVSAFEYGGFIAKKFSKNLGCILGLTNERYGSVSDLAPRLGLAFKF